MTFNLSINNKTLTEREKALINQSNPNLTKRPTRSLTFDSFQTRIEPNVNVMDFKVQTKFSELKAQIKDIFSKDLQITERGNS